MNRCLVLFLAACGGSGSDSDAPMPDAPPPPPSQVVIKNLSATLEGDNVQCSTNGTTTLVTCPEYMFRFVLRNESTKNIAIVDHLRLAFGSEELFNETAGICTLAPWTVAAGAESPLIMVHFTYTRETATDGEFKPRFYFNCGGGWTRAYSPGKYKYGQAVPPLPTAGVVTLKVQGIHDDGGGFVAAMPTVLSP